MATEIIFPSTVARFIELQKEEYATCPLCIEHQTGEMMPRHFLPDRVIDGTLVLFDGECGGNGRRFNPVIEQFIGNAHCTCNACF